jgi:hypothetical protein
VDLTTIYLSICKEHSHKLAHYSSHKKTLWGSLFSSKGSLSLLIFDVLLFWCVMNACFMVLFIGEASQSCLTCMKTLVICLSCKTPSVPCNACTTPSVLCMHHNMCHSYTTPCVHHASCYLSSHATFHFVKCMLDMWQWLDPTHLSIIEWASIHSKLLNLT